MAHGVAHEVASSVRILMSSRGELETVYVSLDVIYKKKKVSWNESSGIKKKKKKN